MSLHHCPICTAPLPERLDDPAEPKACEHAKGQWWERAIWLCPSCEYRANISQMYDCCGSCPRCFIEMKLVVIREDLPF
jgi:hypothetical protein